MEFLKEKITRIFDTTKFVIAETYQFKVIGLRSTDPSRITFNATIADVDEDCLEIIVCIDKKDRSSLETLHKLFREFDISEWSNIYVCYYQISTSMLDGTYSDSVGPLRMEINRLVPEESDD